MFASRWTTINDQGEESPLNPSTEPKVKEVVTDTLPDYNVPDNATVTGGFFDTLQKDVSNTFNAVGETLDDFGAGIKSGAKVFRYLPFIALAAGGYVLLNQSNKKAAYGRK